MSILTVVVPCFNVEQYLVKVLDSYDDDRLNNRLEVLIINDGSSDETQNIAEKYVTARPQVYKVINKENGGHGSGLNFGIEHAQSKYYRVIDGDDWVNTDDMVSLLDYLDTSNADVIIDQKRTHHMITNEEIFYPTTGFEFEKTYNFLDIIGPKSYEYFMLHTMTIKTEILRGNDVTMREKVFYEDYEFVVKSTSLINTVEFVDLDVYRYLIGNANQSVDHSNYVKRYSHHLIVLKEILRFYKQSEITDKRRDKYLFDKIALMINTNMTISLIYNSDRKEGRRQARELRDMLNKEFSEFADATKSRYRLTLALNRLHIPESVIDKVNR